MELRDLLKIMRARWWPATATTLVVLAVCIGISYLRTPTYQGHAEVIVLAQQSSGAILLGSAQDQLPVQPDQSYVLTQARVIQSTLIAGRVVRALGLNMTPAALLQRVTASTDGQSNIVTIDVLEPSADGAAATANAFAEAYIGWSRDNQITSIKAAADQIQRSLTQAQKQADALAKSAGSANGAAASDLQTARALSASLASKLEQLRINQQLAAGSASVLASAVVDPVPVSPDHTRDAGLGLALGLFGGLGMVFLAEQLDTKIRSSEEAERIYDAPVLGIVPREPFRKSEATRLALVHSPDSAVSEAYRALRIGVHTASAKRNIKTLLVTSAAPGEGKSTVASNLSVALSQVGMRVVLLSCDFRRPQTAALFGLQDAIGLSDVLSGERSIGDAIQHPEGLERLSVVTAGPTPPNPSELLGSSRMAALVSNLRESVDWVILDAPPMLATADAAAVAHLADGVLMVARIGVTTRDESRHARSRMERMGGRILGVAVLGVTTDSDAARVYSGYASP